ncbi:alkaline phosphatase family protein [Sporosarcina sp. HYO08]|uniref:alkaline phosphatase family protein n=1 Tax=Sporosarcina sp. HYO08 TaxID=1759557 RepID=UPI000797BCEE|nr:nucleotide pyrophosphatase/phosphodiesterase family protein [Sporosarcina sp. HYO08]KXH84040.1 hypothetical protein AU377_04610 [Sporosarcina sp. HYO08]
MKQKLISLMLSIFVLLTVIPLPLSANANEDPTYMVISFDGMRHDFTKNYMEEGALPYFKKVAENGLFAEDIRTVYPSLTSASHAAISTGAKPGKTGMISNNLHQPGTKLTDKDSAFFSPLQATPIWAEAKRQGKTTATVLFPGSNPEEGNAATYAIYYGTTWAESALDDLTFSEAKQWKKLPKSMSPVREASLTLKLEESENQQVYVLAADTTNNGEIDYDTFYFYLDKNSPHVETVQLNDWGSVSFTINKSHYAGFSFKLKEADPPLDNVKLYRTAVTSAAVQGPGNFKEKVTKNFGHLPVQDDEKALEMKWISRAEYEEISERFAKWTTDVSLYIKEQYKPDLLFFYYPQIDHESHKYLLVDPSQPGYSKKKSKQYMGYIQWAYELADQSLSEALQVMNDTDQLFIVSDHGMEPVHTMISPNHELEKAGLLERDREGKVDPAKSKAYAVASGAIAHIYINVKDRELNGIVSKEQYNEVQQEITDIFTNLEVKKISKVKRIRSLFHQWHQTSANSKSTAKKILHVLLDDQDDPFEKVIAAGSNEANLLQSERSGDVLLIASQGYYIAQDEQATAKKAVDLGNHGGDPERKALRPILLVTGTGYTKATIPNELSTLDIAPTLYTLMDLDAPDFIDGKAIDQITKEGRQE